MLVPLMMELYQILKMHGIICANNNVQKLWQNHLILLIDNLDRLEFPAPIRKFQKEFKMLNKLLFKHLKQSLLERIQKNI
jgi:hypothetical protein